MKDCRNTDLTVAKFHPQSRKPSLFNAAALTSSLMMLAQIHVAAGQFDLEGQSKGSSTWVSGNLQNWQELDYIPCRVRITGKAITNQSIKITFPRLIGTKPGFENLLSFTTSTNVTITSPVLSSPADADWSYTFTVNYTGGGEGYVRFLSRLAAGSYQNGGSSLMLGGEPQSMGKLQIHKPGRSDSDTSFGIPQPIDASEMLPPGFCVEFTSQSNRLYGIQYSSDLVNWKQAQHVITATGSWTRWIDRGLPETESHPSTQQMRFYRLFLLPVSLDN
jgi:hypothetical protein